MIVAAFDFDGTLSRRDTLLPFLVFVRGSAAVGVALARLAPRLALMAAGRADRHDTKERLLGALLKGYPAAGIRAAGRRYAAQLGPHLRSDVLGEVLRHREAGHTLVMVSASPTAYLEPIAEELGFDAVLATELEVGNDQRLTGRLEGPNVRGAEKVARLQAWLDGRKPDELWAYGNSSGDAELLQFANVPQQVPRLVRLPWLAFSPRERTPR